MSAKKERLLFFVYHGTGHFNACFRAAKILSQNFDVVFCGMQFFESYLTSQGFSYIALKTVPFGIGLEKWTNEIRKTKRVHFSTIKDRWNDSLYHERDHELRSIIDDVNPSVILFDAQQSSDFIVLYHLLKARHIRTALLHTMLPTVLQKSTPPLNSSVLAGKSFLTRLAHLKFRSRKLADDFLQMLQYGITNRQIIDRRSKRNGIPDQYMRYRSSSFHFTISGLDELIFTDIKFDFNEVKPGNRQHYIGSLIDNNRAEHGDQEFILRKQEIFRSLSVHKSKLIYCSFGTLPEKDHNSLVDFVTRLINATSNMHCVLLLALDIKSAAVTATLNNHQHVFIFKHLPQLELLQHADLFITHGGLNSVKESIAAKVPMLVYPKEIKTDQYGNSSRIVYHKIGIRGHFKNDTMEIMRRKIDLLLNDNFFKRNLEAFDRDEKREEEKLISLILSLKPL